MEQQETKFQFVYREIKQCILEGQIPPGNALPSSKSVLRAISCKQIYD